MVELTYLENHKSPDNFAYLILTAIVTFLLQISISNLLDELFGHNNCQFSAKSRGIPP